jgi:hypothetical protein
MQQAGKQALNQISKRVIPDGNHPLLLVNSRKYWVKIVSDLIESRKIDPSLQNLKYLSNNWESLLIKTCGSLN